MTAVTADRTQGSGHPVRERSDPWLPDLYDGHVDRRLRGLRRAAAGRGTVAVPDAAW